MLDHKFARVFSFDSMHPEFCFQFSYFVIVSKLGAIYARLGYFHWCFFIFNFMIYLNWTFFIDFDQCVYIFLCSLFSNKSLLLCRSQLLRFVFRKLFPNVCDVWYILCILIIIDWPCGLWGWLRWRRTRRIQRWSSRGGRSRKTRRQTTTTDLTTGRCNSVYVKLDERDQWYIAYISILFSLVKYTYRKRHVYIFTHFHYSFVPHFIKIIITIG